MLDSILFQMVAIVGLGIISQWFAWRFRLPGIVVMSVVGLIVGPFLGLFNPKESFGELFNPIVSLAVAIILFEGSLSLDIREMKDSRRAIFRISTIGSLLAWIGGSFAAHYLAGISLDVAFIVGGIFIVTGPTVIMPLLRQAKLKERPATILKWEGIVVDPFGALVALFALQVVLWTSDKITGNSLLLFFGASILSAILGVVIGFVLGRLLEHGYIPEFLKSPIVLMSVLLVFVLSDTIMHETGLLAVTAMGIVMANMHLTSLRDLLHFKENISVIMISGLFIMLTASLSPDTLRDILNWNMLIFVLAMLFIVRPISIWLSTIGVDLTKQERTLIGWIAPRGIVALTVSGFFAGVLRDEGFEDADIITALTLALVFATVLAHGFSISWLARKLGLRATEEAGVMIAGGSAFSSVLGEAIQSFNKPVLIIDRSWGLLNRARQLGLRTEVGDILSENTEYHVDLTPYETLIAATEDDAYNALICQHFVPELGREQIFQTPIHTGDPSGYSKSIGGKYLFDEEYDIHALNRLIEEGYLIRRTHLTEQYTLGDYINDTDHKTIPLFAVDSENNLVFLANAKKRSFDVGTTIVSLTSPTRMMEKAMEKVSHQEIPPKD
ncbi:cation:proton antiporter [Ureibacillus chungkukjangi]|uniref:Sodium/proton antiporter (CPA1 family) n=1 Tax=Ureibacillus chungkukjangi TaxID=1202712 RepID=A0A318TYZ6_9BACL|nr:sodium:proton antiporter [Ureibacillus chungkukjangi]PYF08258.1 sodium/proton antiporter (CPA1 family) [Ureibacillus chungkukjangi]